MSRTPAVKHLGRRLSRWLALQTMLGLGVVCVAVYLVIAMTLAQRQQETLGHKQTSVEHLLSEGISAHPPEALAHLLNDFLTGHQELSLRISDAQGQLLYAYPQRPPNVASARQRRFAVDMPGPEPGMGQAVLQLDAQADDRLLRRLAWTLALAAGVGSLLVSLASAWLVGRGLAPLRQLVEQTRRLSAPELHRRLDDTGQPQELRPLIHQFNDLLDRLAVAYQQMEAFNADVAHELNTPLTTLISSCELALRKPRSAEQLCEVLQSNLEDLQRMAGIVSDMLFLSQADRGQGARRSPIDSLATLALEVIDFHEAALLEAGVQAQVQGDASMHADARLLRRALSNLLGNATRYAAAGSLIQVEITSSRCGHHPDVRMSCLSVINTGTTIAPEHLPRLFDRFYRADAARTPAEGRHGLGLSIVAAIARMHGGQPRATSALGMTCISLEIPDEPARH